MAHQSPALLEGPGDGYISQPTPASFSTKASTDRYIAEAARPTQRKHGKSKNRVSTVRAVTPPPAPRSTHSVPAISLGFSPRRGDASPAVVTLETVERLPSTLSKRLLSLPRSTYSDIRGNRASSALQSHQAVHSSAEVKIESSRTRGASQAQAPRTAGVSRQTGGPSSSARKGEAGKEVDKDGVKQVNPIHDPQAKQSAQDSTKAEAVPASGLSTKLPRIGRPLAEGKSNPPASENGSSASAIRRARHTHTRKRLRQSDTKPPSPGPSTSTNNPLDMAEYKAARQKGMPASQLLARVGSTGRWAVQAGHTVPSLPSRVQTQQTSPANVPKPAKRVKREDGHNRLMGSTSAVIASVSTQLRPMAFLDESKDVPIKLSDDEDDYTRPLNEGRVGIMLTQHLPRDSAEAANNGDSTLFEDYDDQGSSRAASTIDERPPSSRAPSSYRSLSSFDDIYSFDEKV